MAVAGKKDATKTVSKKAAKKVTEKKESAPPVAAKKVSRINTSSVTAEPNKELLASLKEHFGFNKFKGEQQRIIENLMNGKDAFVIMP
ncbi:MAG: hypothetical protein LH629_06385, partial [Ignavibacteria bacterium]|nr:hypothetical protein [Ignavibacteria bacterium]